MQDTLFWELVLTVELEGLSIDSTEVKHRAPIIQISPASLSCRVLNVVYSQPLIVITLQADVILHSHDARKRQSGFVNEVQRVYDAEQGHQMPIDPFEEPPIGSLVDFHVFKARYSNYGLVCIDSMLAN